MDSSGGEEEDTDDSGEANESTSVQQRGKNAHPWTAEQLATLKQFIEREKTAAAAAGQKDPSNIALARAVLVQRVPVGGPRSEQAIAQKVRILQKDPGYSGYYWTKKQTAALTEFIHQEKSAVSRHHEPPTVMELARRAVVQLVPSGVLGSHCSKEGIYMKIKDMEEKRGGGL